MKKLLSLFLVTALLCGCSAQKMEQSTTTTTSETTTVTTSEEPEEEGKEFNILCMDTSPMLRDLKDYYPGYEITKENGKTTEKIGDITVNWVYYPPNADGSPYLFYEQFLRDDRNVPNLVHNFGHDIGEIDLVFINSNSSFSDKLIEDYAIPLSEIGITEDDTAGMYDYTLQCGTYDGKLLSLMREIQPVVFLYRRSIAEKVLGTSDPEKVKEYVSNWEKFTETAELMKENGYSMVRTSSEIMKGADLTSGGPIHKDGKVYATEKALEFRDLIKDYQENGYISGERRWNEDWFESFAKDNTFGALEATWFVDYTLAGMCGESSGDWAVCEGPSSDFHYGYRVFVPQKTDNPTLAAEMVRTLYCDEEFMMNYVGGEKFDGGIPNNKNIIKQLFDADKFKSETLGGQNPYAVYSAVAEKINAENTTSMDEEYTIKLLVEWDAA